MFFRIITTVYGQYAFGQSLILGGTAKLFNYDVFHPSFTISDEKLSLNADLDFVVLKGTANIGFEVPLKGTSYFNLTAQSPDDWSDDTPAFIEDAVDWYFNSDFPAPSGADYSLGLIACFF